jgi:histidine triad (HIT) family protein
VEPARDDCRFCKIVARSVPAAIVFEDDRTMAFLDNHPLFLGHALLVPKAHYETLPDLPPDLIAPLFGNAQLLARAVQEALTADGTFIAINNKVSQSVPHLHVHVVPRRFKDGLKGFFWPRQLYPSPEEMESTAQAIDGAFTRLRTT